jgi:hypothetical protein
LKDYAISGWAQNPIRNDYALNLKSCVRLQYFHKLLTNALGQDVKKLCASAFPVLACNQILFLEECIQPGHEAPSQ